MTQLFKINIFILILIFSLFSCKMGYSENKSVPDTGKTAITSESDSSLLNLQGKLHAIAKNEAPAIVFIGTEKTVTQQYSDPFEFFFGSPFDQNPRNKNPNQQRKFKQSALGSGVLYRKAGNNYYIVTNNHVIEGADKIQVTVGENKTYTAKLVGSDPDVDIALIKIETGDSLKLSRFGDSNKISVGDIVIAIGNPFGFSGTMTMGIISALGRSDIGSDSKPSLTDFIQTDASINPGNSGGSLMNIDGEVIGINTMIYSQTGMNAGIGFAIPVNLVKKVADEFIDKGKTTIEHGYLGVGFEELTEEKAKTLELKYNYGMLVGSVFDGSPAEKAGIKTGDLLLEVNGKQLKKSSDLTMTVGNSTPGTKLNFKVFRDNQVMNITVILGNRTELSRQTNQPSDSTALADYGIQVAELNSSLRSQYKIPANAAGVVITGIAQGSPANSAGIAEGDVIFKINSKKISNINDVTKILNDNKNDQNYFFILRQGKEIMIRM